MLFPKFSLDFTSALLDSKITFTRTGATATRVNSSGLIESVAADTPRFDFNPVTKICRGLLIENQQINLAIYSEQFNNTAWGKTRSTVSANSAVAPDGNNTADKIVEDSQAGTHIVFAKTISIISGTTYTFSVYAKAAGRSWIAIQGNAGNLLGLAYFDLANGVLGNVASGTQASIVDYGGGWYRCSFTRTVDANTVSDLLVYLSNANGSISYTGDAASGVHLWGAQFEAESSATSYIPTTTAAVTRNADVATITGTAFSGFWRSGPGSILVRALPSTVSGTRPLVQVDDATADNIIALRGNATNPELYIRAGGSDQATIDAGTISAAAYRLAGAWQAGSAAASLNSGLAVNGAPASIPAVTQMRLGSDGTNYLNGHLQAVEYWPVRLSNASLQNASSTAGYQSIIHPVLQDTII